MNFFFRKILVFGFSVIVIFAFCEIANACSCSPYETIDREFAGFSNIAVLKLQKVGEVQKSEENVNIFSSTGYFLTVEKVFKGNLKIGETLKFSPSLFCTWSFEQKDEGRQFLFYLDKQPKNNEPWIADYCTRSGSISARAADMLYLEKEKKVRGKTRLSGDLTRMIEKADSNDRYDFSALSNKKIRITGNGKIFETLTDENGVYEIYDLPPGKYKIYPEKIPDLISYSLPEKEFKEVEIKPKSHTEEDFYFEIDNEISGKVTDIYGNPLENACLDLVLAGNDKTKDYSKGACTGKNGQFEINSIPPGTYNLVINKSGEITVHRPFSTFYYPNAKNLTEATEFTFSENTFVKNLQITPPEMIGTVTISGVLTYKNGQPVPDENVHFISEKETFRTFDGKVADDDEIHTDSNGRFTFKVWKGQSGFLRSSIFSFLGKYKNCPEIDELLRQKGDSVQRLDTIGVTIDATESLNDIKLKFPFSKCEEAADDEN